MRERSWEVDYAGITRAKDALGIRLDVEIRLVGNAVHHAGRYRPRQRDGRLVHSITVSSWEDKQRAGEILWHELAHADQTERDMGAEAVTDALAARRKPTAATVAGIRRRHARVTREQEIEYAARPSEVEARAAEEFNAEIPLTKTSGQIALRPWRAPSVAEALTMSEYRRKETS